MDVSIKLFAALTGTDPDAYPAAGVDISELGEIEMIGGIKSSTIEDYVKNVHLRKCQITGFTFTYSVDAESTEEYNVSGTEKRWFTHDVIVDTFDTLPDPGGPYALTQTPIQLKNGNYAMSAIIDKVYLDEVHVAPATGEYQINPAGPTITTADTYTSALVVVYHANPAGNNWSDISDLTIPAAIRGKSVNVLIGTNDIERIQSVTIRGTFPNEVITEMGNTSVVGTITQVPDVTGDISILDTDLELIALFTTGAVVIPSGVYEFRDCEFTASGISLEIQLYEPASGCIDLGAPPILKTVYIPQIKITSEGHTTNVGGNATQTFGFESVDAQCIVYSGAR